MLKVYLGGILMVIGMAALLANPVIGGIFIAIGAGLFFTSTKAQRSDASATFFGFAILCGAVVAAATLFDVIF